MGWEEMGYIFLPKNNQNNGYLCETRGARRI